MSHHIVTNFSCPNCNELGIVVKCIDNMIFCPFCGEWNPIKQPVKGDVFRALGTNAKWIFCGMQGNFYWFKENRDDYNREEGYSKLAFVWENLVPEKWEKA